MIKRPWIIVCCIALFLFLTPVFAQNTNDVNQRIQDLQNKISDLQGQEDSLSKKISILNSQIALTTLKISNTRTNIDKLESEINDLTDEIARLETLLTKRTELVLRRIPESYKRQSAPRFGILLLSQNFSDFISRVKYLTTVEAQDAQLLFQLKATQNNFSERKKLREDKKTQQEALNAQLVTENADLDRQKKEKQSLLDQTKNSETVYQTLLAQALAERQAIERALVEGVQVGPVKRGDPIALVGNTGYPGCSTGAHLHFEVRKNNTWVDPGGYLSSKTVIDDQDGGTSTIGSGNWDWPLSDPIRLEQHFGKTPYSWRYAYSGGIHTGLDLVSTSSDVIRAPNDGTLYSSSESCGGTSIIKIKYIDHGDGVISFYLHVQ